MANYVDLARQWREWLWRNGYSPVPIRNGTKFPTARRWPERARLGEFANMPPDSDSLGTGIECSGLRAVDFDIDDDAIIARILLLPSDILIPPGAIRFRDGSPRMIWLYRAEEGNPRKRTIKGTHGTVEVLGHGQQFVAIGMHPSGVPYQWDRTLPPRGSLPAITEQQVELLFDKIAPLIGAVAAAKSQQRTHDRRQPKSEPGHLIERIKSGEQWDDNMLRLIAHWVAVKRDDAEILAWAEPLTLAAFTIDQTVQEMQTMINGARAKGFDQRETRKEAAQAAFAKHDPMKVDPFAASHVLPGLSGNDPSPLKRELIVNAADRPETVRDVLKLLIQAGNLFDRGGVLVRLVRQPDGDPPVALALKHNNVIVETHQHCQPVRFNARGVKVAITLPDSVAHMLLDLGEWGLPPLAGVATAPLLSPDGSILVRAGYDQSRAMWCEPVPDLTVPIRPTRGEADAALFLLRNAFRTFPFARSPMESSGAIMMVNTTKPPSAAESAFLAAL